MGAPIYKMGDLSSKILADASDDVSKLNTSNTVEEDKPVISVREGKQKRKEQFEIDKKAIKDKRDDKINALGKNQENLPEGIRRKKEARTTKRRDMHELRDIKALSESENPTEGYAQRLIADVGSNLSSKNQKIENNTASQVKSNITPESPVDMLGPTQQKASEDSQGISSFMMNSKNRRGH